MTIIATERLSDTVGVEILDVDVERLLTDDELPAACLDLLEEHSVLLFRELHAGDDAQVSFSRTLGTLVQFPKYPNPNIMEVSFDPGNPNAKYLPSNDFWHLDGFMDEIPARASIMSAHEVTDVGGETGFASTYAAYDDLSAAEKEHFAGLRVIHSMAKVQRLSYPNPTAEQEADWARWADREHPLVWKHESGRKSLVFGSSAARIIGMDLDESQAILADLERRATTPDRIYKHTWAVGDLVIWDNTGLLHRACEFDRSTPRRMHRTTLAGQEPVT